MITYPHAACSQDSCNKCAPVTGFALARQSNLKVDVPGPAYDAALKCKLQACPAMHTIIRFSGLSGLELARSSVKIQS